MSSPTLEKVEKQVSRSLKREEQCLVMGKSAFVKHMKLPNQVYATILTSTRTHINIKSIDFSMVAVKLVNPFSKVTPPIGDKFLDYCMDVSKVRYVGELVVAVVAEDPYLSYDALEQIEIEYEPLPAIVDAKAFEAGAHVIRCW